MLVLCALSTTPLRRQPAIFDLGECLIDIADDNILAD